MEKYAIAHTPDTEAEIIALRSRIRSYILGEILSRKRQTDIIDGVKREIERFISSMPKNTDTKSVRAELLAFARKAYDTAVRGVQYVTPYAVSEAFSKGGESDGEQTETKERLEKFAESYSRLDSDRAYNFGSTSNGGADSFERYLAAKKALISNGVKIVYVPPHANCSKRCQPYQGRLYSLDGTRGSIDGKPYIPIEEVADKITVSAKNSGRTHNAGLFAYNCRHKMQEYESRTVLEEIPDGVIEHYRRAEAKQKSIAAKIRALKAERDTYTALYKKTQEREIYRKASALNLKAKSLIREYIAISKEYDMPMSADVVKSNTAR